MEDEGTWSLVLYTIAIWNWSDTIPDCFIKGRILFYLVTCMLSDGKPSTVTAASEHTSKGLIYKWVAVCGLPALCV